MPANGAESPTPMPAYKLPAGTADNGADADFRTRAQIQDDPTTTPSPRRSQARMRPAIWRARPRDERGRQPRSRSDRWNPRRASPDSSGLLPPRPSKPVSSNTNHISAKSTIVTASKKDTANVLAVSQRSKRRPRAPRERRPAERRHAVDSEITAAPGHSNDRRILTRLRPSRPYSGMRGRVPLTVSDKNDRRVFDGANGDCIVRRAKTD